MNIDLNLINQLTEELNTELNSLSIEIDKIQTEISNLEISQKESDLKIEDYKKIAESYSNNNNNTHDVFSPLNNQNNSFEKEIDSSELDILQYENTILLEKIDNKKQKLDNLQTSFDSYSELIQKLVAIRSNVKKQVDTYNNEYFILQLKEIVQKKRLITLEKTKYSPVIGKVESNIYEKSLENLEQMKLAYNFIQTDPIRAKQELEKAYKQLNTIINNTKNIISKYTKEEPDQALCDSLNAYIGELVQIYPDIKFHLTVANLKPINHINIDLNRCLMSLFKGLINAFILKCNTMMIYLRFAYEDGYLNVTGKVIGKYINFYNEMKQSPTSIIGNMYEKIFLLNATINFKDNKDGTFNVKLKIPIKNYLA